MRDDWEFFVTFFSFLTHMTHQESFKYLQEASRCLKASGKVVISFLEFRIPCHWETFRASVKAKTGGPLIQFLGRDAIAAWAGRSGLAIDAFFDGDKVISRFPKRSGGKMEPR